MTPFLTLTFEDGRVVELSEIDAWNLGESLVAAVRLHQYPPTRQVFRDLHARIAPPQFEIVPVALATAIPH